MLRVLVLVVASAALGCRKQEAPTPPGTTVLDWDLAKTTPNAKIGPRKTIDRKMRYRDMDLDLRLESADVDFIADGKHVEGSAPVLVRLTVRRSPHWKLSVTCQNYPADPRKAHKSPGAESFAEGNQMECWLTLRFTGQRSENAQDKDAEESHLMYVFPDHVWASDATFE